MGDADGVRDRYTRSRDNGPDMKLEVYRMLLTAVLLPAAEGGFTALNPETGSTSEGETVEEALANLREATQLFVEEFSLSVAGQPLVTSFEIAARA